MDRSEIRSQKKYNEETVCDMFGAYISALIRENGIDIFRRIKEFTEA
jgi:dsRNA-specific ribonuclease